MFNMKRKKRNQKKRNQKKNAKQILMRVNPILEKNHHLLKKTNLPKD